MTMIATVKELDTFRDTIIKDRKKIKTTLSICCGPGCHASRSLDVIEAIKDELTA